MKSDPYLTRFVNIDSKWIKGLNLTAKTTKLLKENVG